MIRQHRILVLSISFSMIVLASSSGIRSAENKQGQITCTGTVVDERDQPVAGAEVFLYKLLISMEWMSFDVELVQSTTTKDDGTFTFVTAAEDNPMNNQTIILVDKEGLALGWANWYLTKDHNLRIPLGPSKVLAGHVVDESGGPVSNAEIMISVMLITDGSEPCYITGKVSEQLFSRKTNTEGKFRFERIPAEAAAEFIVKRTGLATVGTLDEANAQRMQLQFKAGQEDIEIKLPIEAKIEGRVVETETDKPVSGIQVIVFQGDLQPFSGYEPVISREDGTFSIDALRTGELILWAAPQEEGRLEWVSQPVKVTVEAGRTTMGVKVILSKSGKVEISVTDLYGSSPISGASVGIQNTLSKQQFTLTTNKDGTSQKTLAPGEYQMTHAYKQDYPYERQEKTFTIENGKTSRVTIQMKGYPKVTGTVRDEKGRPVAGARIKVCPLGRGEATSDSEGRYEVRRETPEWAPVIVPFVVARHFEQNLAGAVEFAEDAKVVDLIMTAGVTCVGKVVDPDGKPIENAQVYLTFWSAGSGSSMARQKNTTDIEGNYEIKAVPRSHEYSVNASANGYGQDYVRISAEDTEGNRCEVDPIVLAPANLSVSGIVVDMDDKPVDNAQVSCQDRGQPYRNTKTDKDGRFTLENVCAGKITINAHKSVTTHMSGYTETEGGTADVQVTISERPSSTRSEPKRPPSLVGKSLPDLKALGVRLSPGDIDGKRLLICFWDMQQRPSRHCLTQLTEQAESLKNNGIIVVVVQASKIEQNALDAWVKKYNVPFSVGMLREDAETTCFDWGVQSLPWLILTDRTHIIQSAGFSATELNEKIKEMTDEKR